MAVTRGCGTRVKGGIYISIPLGKHGQPIEYFLRCTPEIVNSTELGISPIGVKLIEVNGVYHVFDWVGKTHYPNVADFVEEARRFGISRRLSTNFDFKKLTSESRLILLHERAYIDNFDQFEGPNLCPKNVSKHNAIKTIKQMCIGLWWKDIEDGEETGKEDLHVVRQMPSFEYEGYARPEHIKREYHLAIFGAFPIPRLVVINDPEDSTHEKSLEKARAASLPVYLEDE